jgi:hypothetical protein
MPALCTLLETFKWNADLRIFDHYVSCKCSKTVAYAKVNFRSPSVQAELPAFPAHSLERTWSLELLRRGAFASDGALRLIARR